MSLSINPNYEPLVPNLNPDFVIAHLGPELMQQTRDVRIYARHHAGFKVGAVAVASNALNQTAVFQAANRNNCAGPNPTKLCAEQKVIHQMRRLGYDKLHALFVSGPQQPDPQSGLNAPTLHPCGECREFMTEADEVDEDTLLVPLHPTEDTYELYSLPELTILHDAPGIGHRNLNVYQDDGFQKWQQNAQSLDSYTGGLRVDGEVEATRASVVHMAVTGKLGQLAFSA